MIIPPSLQAHALLIHSAFETLALLVGAYLYRRALENRQSNLLEPQRLAVAIGCLFGAGTGNKAMFWIERPDLFTQHVHSFTDFFIAGQSMTGGLIGGLIGVELAKWLTRQRTSTGDLFVTPILVGLIIGRIGCFLAGLQDSTFGTPTSLPWGIDFGDGVPRHPAQIYDQLFALLALYLRHHYRPQLDRISGLTFRLLLLAYLGWRVLVDFLKPVDYAYPLGWSGIQWACLIFVVIYAPLTYRFARQRHEP